MHWMSVRKQIEQFNRLHSLHWYDFLLPSHQTIFQYIFFLHVFIELRYLAVVWWDCSNPLSECTSIRSFIELCEEMRKHQVLFDCLLDGTKKRAQVTNLCVTQAFFTLASPATFHRCNLFFAVAFNTNYRILYFAKWAASWRYSLKVFNDTRRFIGFS